MGNMGNIAKWLKHQPSDQKTPGSTPGYVNLVLLFP